MPIPDKTILNPVLMSENQNWVLISNPPEGILVADRYGNYIRTIESPDSGLFHTDDLTVSFVNNDMVNIVTISNGEKKTFSLPKNQPFRDIVIMNNATITSTGDFIQIWK
jgi:hypothetical protein